VLLFLPLRFVRSIAKQASSGLWTAARPQFQPSSTRTGMKSIERSGSLQVCCFWA
jgi:hypothetical protein